MKKFNIYVLISYLFIILIPTKVLVGKKIFFGVAILCGVMYIVYAYKNKLQLSTFEKIFPIFIFVYFLFSFYSPSEKTAFYVTKLMTTYFIGAVSSIKLLYNYYEKDIDKTLKKIGYTFIISTIAISLYCLVTEGITKRLGSIVFLHDGTYMELSYNLTCSLFIILFFVLNDKKNKKTNLFILLLILVFIGLSGTRKVLVGMVIYILITLLLRYRYNFLKILSVMVKILAIIILLLLLIIKVPIFYNIIGSRVESLFGYVTGKTFEESAEERKNMRTLAFEKFKENKIIGVGSDGFRHYYFLQSGRDLYSHCNILELLCDLGLIGFASYYYYHFYMIITNLKKLAKYTDFNKYSYFIISTLVTCFILDYGTISYYQIQFIFLFSLLSIINFSLKKICE